LKTKQTTNPAAKSVMRHMYQTANSLTIKDCHVVTEDFPDPAIARRMAELEKAIGSLESSLTELETRLAPVLSPAGLTTGAADHGQPRCSESPLAELICEQAERVAVLESRVRELTGRLEI